MDLNRLVVKLVQRLSPFAKVLWQDWGIQGLVVLSLFAQIFLAIFGQRRKYMTSLLIRFLIWAAYLLSAYVATIALGKLTVVQIDDPTTPGYHAELLGLLAPVTLMHLGNPNSITAYSVEDNRLGFRQYINIAATVAFVAWILIRCWDGNSPVSKLFFPLFAAGLLTSIGWVWCLDSVYRKNSSVTPEDMDFNDEYASFHGEEKTLLQGPPKVILQAFYRFDCLKPHIADWLYHPEFIEFEQTKIDENDAAVVFSTTEIELGFMYDVLYTKAPILYTRIGIIGRFLIVLSLASALSGFSMIFRNTFLVDMYIVYTYAILVAVLTHELYQTMLLPFSDWAVVKMIRLRRYTFMLRMISCVAGICIKQRRWSKTLGQLNLFVYCRQKEFPRPVSTLLWLFGKEETAKRHWVQSRPPIPPPFMEMLHKYMKALEEKRKRRPFNMRGSWTFERYNVRDSTLVALRPQLLSLTTTDVTMGYACKKLAGFLRYRTDQRAFKNLSEEGPLPRMEVNNEAQEIQETFITKDWDVLSEARKLAKSLQAMPGLDKWKVMRSIWVEMLCFAAYNCQVYHHAKMLRCGGELITHIWLILLHKTDKYEITNIKVDEMGGGTSKPTIESPKNREHPWIKFLCR